MDVYHKIACKWDREIIGFLLSRHRSFWTKMGKPEFRLRFFYKSMMNSICITFMLGEI